MNQTNDMPQTTSIQRLIQIMEDLRNPDTGCTWDKEQTFETIAPYTIEEAYEVADAIKKNDREALKDELGDLLFQIVFYAQISKENDGYDFNDIADTISEKMVRRHPHVFKKKSLEQAKAKLSLGKIKKLKKDCIETTHRVHWMEWR